MMTRRNPSGDTSLPQLRMGDELDVSELSDRLGYNLRRTYAVVLEDLSKALEPFDIRPRQYGILITVADNPGVSQGQVAQALGIARTNFVPMVDKLESKGLLRRMPSATDRRSHSLQLTQEGEKLSALLRKIDAEHERSIRSIIGETQSTELIRLLQQIRGHLSAMDVG